MRFRRFSTTERTNYRRHPIGCSFEQKDITTGDFGTCGQNAAGFADARPLCEEHLAWCAALRGQEVYERA